MRRISHQWAGGKVHGLDIGYPAPAISKWTFLVKILPPLFQEIWPIMHSGRKIRVAQKNVIEEKLLEIKRSIRWGSYIYFPDSYGGSYSIGLITKNK